MLINQDECIQCQACIPYCPVSAIEYKDDIVDVNQENCVECNACLRANVCPVDAFEAPKLSWPRSLRNAFSDPHSIHETTNHKGRGTEEVKTNDVTGLVKPGQAGFALEVGRPGIGTTLRDVERLTMALAQLPYVQFAEKSPITHYMVDQTGKLREDILQERVLSAIVEFIVPVEDMGEVVETFRKAATTMETVFSAAVFFAVGPQGELPPLEFFSNLGLEVLPGGKTNLGLGRPLVGR